MEVSSKDIEIDITDINSKTKQRYSIVGRSSGKYILTNENGSREFSYRLTKRELACALDMLNRVLSYEVVESQ